MSEEVRKNNVSRQMGSYQEQNTNGSYESAVNMNIEKQSMAGSTKNKRKTFDNSSQGGGEIYRDSAIDDYVSNISPPSKNNMTSKLSSKQLNL